MILAILATVLAATKPWTHWVAPPLLVAEIAYLVGIGIRYYRKVQVPGYLWKLRNEGRGTPRLAGRDRVRIQGG